jgi:hypothetical protein
MKNLILRSAFSVMVAACSITAVNAQCPPAPSSGIHYNDQNCFVQGEWNERTWSFKNYDEFVFSPTVTVDIDSIRIDRIDSLPCGIMWTTSNADKNNVFKELEQGCISFYGTTSDPMGQYNPLMKITAFVSGSAPVDSIDSRLGGIRVDLTVVAAGSTCTPVDTNGAFQQSSCLRTTLTGIDDLNEVTSFSNSPNPFNTATIISFTASEARNYTLKVYDVTGRIVHESAVNAKNGKNDITFSRKGLDAGVYFYSLSNGKEKISNKMVIGQ